MQQTRITKRVQPQDDDAETPPTPDDPYGVKIRSWTGRVA